MQLKHAAVALLDVGRLGPAAVTSATQEAFFACWPFFPVQELNDRDRFLQVLLEKYQQASVVQGAADQQQQQQPGAMQAAAAGAAGGSKLAAGSGLPVNAVNSGPPLLLEEAVAVIIRNERGRQVRAETTLCTAVCSCVRLSSTCIALWARRGVHRRFLVSLQLHMAACIEGSCRRRLRDLAAADAMLWSNLQLVVWQELSMAYTEVTCSCIACGCPCQWHCWQHAFNRSCYGPQARERARMMAATKRSRALATQRIAAGLPVAKDDAACVIQSGIRGALWRRRVKREADQELIFIGMKPKVCRAAFT